MDIGREKSFYNWLNLIDKLFLDLGWITSLTGTSYDGSPIRQPMVHTHRRTVFGARMDYKLTGTNYDGSPIRQPMVTLIEGLFLEPGWITKR